MEAYRDQYATLFNAGRNVTVIGVSADDDSTQADWAREKGFPIVFASDKDGTVGKRYGAFNAQYKLENRFLFVIGPDGRIAYRAIPFRVLAQQAYADMQAAVTKLLPAPKDSTAGPGAGASSPR